MINISIQRLLSLHKKDQSLDLKELFSYPLGRLPVSIAETDGTLKKTDKSQLMHKIEGDVEPVNQIVEDYAFIADGMAFLRQIPTTKLTYKDFAVKLLKLVLLHAKNAKRVDVVFDCYFKNSIKDIERMRRLHGNVILKHIVPTSQIKQWSHLLSSEDFKKKLVNFVVNECRNHKTLLGNKILYARNDEETIRIASNSIDIIAALRSDHEETDTRMCLHAKPASHEYPRIVISIPDTDVFMISLSASTRISFFLYIMTGTRDKRRLIDMNTVADHAYQRFNKTNCSKRLFFDATLGLYCFTGCDSTSSFAAKGKVKPL